jgi:exopolysaccharide biosynthesis polyprenyl glycosylphosphotransferase
MEELDQAAVHSEGGGPGALSTRLPFPRWKRRLNALEKPTISGLQAEGERLHVEASSAAAAKLQAGRSVPHLRPLPAARSEASVWRSARGRDAAYRRLLAVADVVGAIGALLLTQALAGIEFSPALLLAGALSVVVVGKAIGLYDREELLIGKATLSEAPALFQLATLYTLLVTTFTSANANPMPASAILGLWALLFVSSLLFRSSARQLVRSRTRPERCLVLGTQEQADRVRTKFNAYDSIHAEVVAHLPFSEFELARPRQTDFARYVIERDIHRVIVGQSDAPDKVLESVRYFKEYGLKVSVLPNILEVVGSSVEFDEIHGTTMLGVRSFGLSRSSRNLKRIFDFVGSALLLIFAAPLLAAIAIAIKLDSRGPVLFSQTRVGRDGLRFTLHKFRTMYDGADRLRAELADRNGTEGLFKLADDPRITRVGRFLRRTSLDELPQLINVLRGEMSLVGPRPLVEDEDQRVEGWHRRRLHITPGMTGAWQIMGEMRVPLNEMVFMDYMYIVNWSLWSDIRILVQTAGHVLRRRGL